VLDLHLRRGLFPSAQTAVIHNARKWEQPLQSLPVSAPGAVLRIGYIGRIEESKGIEPLLQAVTRLTPGSWILRIAGRAPSSEYLAHLRHEYPSSAIDYLGFVRSQDFYPTIDVLVVPSLWHEPLGMVVCESLGYGVPVFASDAGGIAEILAGTGAGRLFPAGDAERLVALFVEAMADRTGFEAMRANALQRRRFFVPERQANEFLAAIQSVDLASRCGRIGDASSQRH
jgi:glycosyltransferase involved in cell wall biosynthesis